MEDDEYSKLKKQIKFNLEEQEIIKQLNIEPDVFLPLLFSFKFGGDWSFSTKSQKVLAVKDKLTSYDPEKKVGATLEVIYLLTHPRVLNEEGLIYRMEKCSQKKEREIVERPFKVEIDGEEIIKAVLDPKTLEISIKRIKGPLSFEGSTAFGVAHEMGHLTSSDDAGGKCLWDFSYKLED